MNTEFTPFNADQSRLLIDASNQYDQWLTASRELNQYKGWMTWRTQSGIDYLIHGHGSGNQKSLGPRSLETETRYQTFVASKEQAQDYLKQINDRLAERAPMLKALRMGRILEPMAKVIREFDVAGMLGSRLLIGGTQAISAYEALAGQWLDASMTATEDLDFVWRQGLSAEVLVKQAPEAIMLHLKKIDASYTVNTERTFQVRNAKGMIIDFISDEAGAKDSPKEYLKPIAITGQEWLIASQNISVVAIDSSGFPVRLVVPDPRTFAIHKAWVAKRPDRSPLKVAKDIRQSQAVAILVKKYLPQYKFDEIYTSSLNKDLQKVYFDSIHPLLSKIQEKFEGGM